MADSAQSWRDRRAFLDQTNEELQNAVWDNVPVDLPDLGDREKVKNTLLVLCAKNLREKAERDGAVRYAEIPWHRRHRKVENAASHFLAARYRRLETTMKTRHLSSEQEHKAIEGWLSNIITAPEHEQWLASLEALTDREAQSAEESLGALDDNHCSDLIDYIGQLPSFTPIQVPVTISVSGADHLAKANAALAELHSICANNPRELEGNQLEAQKKLLANKARASLDFCYREMLNRARANEESMFSVVRRRLNGVHEHLYSGSSVKEAQDFLSNNADLFDLFDFNDEINAVSSGRLDKEDKMHYIATIGKPGRPIPELPEFSEKALQEALRKFREAGHKFEFRRYKDGSFRLRFLTGYEGNPYASAYHVDYSKESEYFISLLKSEAKAENKAKQKPAGISGHAEDDKENVGHSQNNTTAASLTGNGVTNEPQESAAAAGAACARPGPGAGK